MIDVSVAIPGIHWLVSNYLPAVYDRDDSVRLHGTSRITGALLNPHVTVEVKDLYQARTKVLTLRTETVELEQCIPVDVTLVELAQAGAVLKSHVEDLLEVLKIRVHLNDAMDLGDRVEATYDLRRSTERIGQRIEYDVSWINA
jgi:hypothetical protein